MGTSEKLGLAISGNETGDSIGQITNDHHHIGDEQIPNYSFSIGQGLNLDIINEYGQLMGEYSRLDDELWFSKPEDDDAMASCIEGLDWNSTPSCEHIELKQLSNFSGNSVSDGGQTFAQDDSSSLKDSSVNESQISSPNSVLQRRKSCSNVRTRAMKHTRVEFSRPELDEMIEPIPAKKARTKKLSDLLQSGSGLRDQSLKRKPFLNKKCMHCESTKTPQWREGPMGPKTLCNACGVQYKFGRLFSDYRPLRSPTFDPSLHSNLPKKAQEMRMGDCSENNPNPNRERRMDDVSESDHNPNLRARNPNRKSPREAVNVKKCLHCESTRTPQWREGPMGRNTLCNACGVQYKKGDCSENNPNPNRERRMDDVSESDHNPNLRARNPNRKPPREAVNVKKCLHCESTRTPQWREGPMGRNTLCNACGVQYKKGRLFSEYRPLRSPTFDPSLHSSSPKKVQLMRTSMSINNPVQSRLESRVRGINCTQPYPCVNRETVSIDP